MLVFCKILRRYLSEWFLWWDVVWDHEKPEFWGLFKNMNCAFPLICSNISWKRSHTTALLIFLHFTIVHWRIRYFKTFSNNNCWLEIRTPYSQNRDNLGKFQKFLDQRKFIGSRKPINREKFVLWWNKLVLLIIVPMRSAIRALKKT